MRKMFAAVSVAVMAVGFSACSQDISGPTVERRFSKGGNGNSVKLMSDSTGKTVTCPLVIVDDAPESAKANGLRAKCN